MSLKSCTHLRFLVSKQETMKDINSPSQAAWPCLLPEADLYSARHQSNTHSATDTEAQPHSLHTNSFTTVYTL